MEDLVPREVQGLQADQETVRWSECPANPVIQAAAEEAAVAEPGAVEEEVGEVRETSEHPTGAVVVVSAEAEAEGEAAAAAAAVSVEVEGADPLEKGGCCFIET